MYNTFVVVTERYRIQCDRFEGMWLVTKELMNRLNSHYNKGKTGSFSMYYSSQLPLQEYFDLIDTHFEVLLICDDIYIYVH